MSLWGNIFKGAAKRIGSLFEGAERTAARDAARTAARDAADDAAGAAVSAEAGLFNQYKRIMAEKDSSKRVTELLALQRSIGPEEFKILSDEYSRIPAPRTFVGAGINPLGWIFTIFDKIKRGVTHVTGSKTIGHVTATGVAIATAVGLFPALTTLLGNTGLVSSNIKIRESMVDAYHARQKPSILNGLIWYRDKGWAFFGYPPSLRDQAHQTADNMPGLPPGLPAGPIDPNNPEQVSQLTSRIYASIGDFTVHEDDPPARAQQKQQLLTNFLTADLNARGQQVTQAITKAIEQETDVRAQLFAITGNHQTLVDGHRPSPNELIAAHPELAANFQSLTIAQWNNLIPQTTDLYAVQKAKLAQLNEFISRKINASQIVDLTRIDASPRAQADVQVSSVAQANARSAAINDSNQLMENRILHVGDAAKYSDGTAQFHALDPSFVGKLLNGGAYAVALPTDFSNLNDMAGGAYDFRNNTAQSAPRGNVTPLMLKDGKSLAIITQPDPNDVNAPGTQWVLVKFANGKYGAMLLDDYNKLGEAQSRPAPAASADAQHHGGATRQPASFQRDTGLGSSVRLTPASFTRGGGDNNGLLIRTSLHISGSSPYGALRNQGDGYRVSAPAVSIGRSPRGANYRALSGAPEASPSRSSTVRHDQLFASTNLTNA